MAILERFTDQIEQISIDEAFLDITQMGGSPRSIGEQIQRTIQEELDLPSSIGIASNKLVAKIATDVGKMAAGGDQPPKAITVVPPGEERSFLAPLPVQMLWGVGPKTKERLELFNIHTIGDLAAYSEVELAKSLGKMGYDLSRRAKGIDLRGIVRERGIKSVSNETTFRDDLDSKSAVLEQVNRLSSKVARRLNKKKLRGKTIQIKLRWSDFTTLTRQTTLSQSTRDEATIQSTAAKLLNEVWEDGRSARLVGVGVHNLDTQAQQLGLWDEGLQKDIQLQEAVKQIREKYGEKVITRGSDNL
jgi:DNA polymerase-4